MPRSMLRSKKSRRSAPRRRTRSLALTRSLPWGRVPRGRTMSLEQGIQKTYRYSFNLQPCVAVMSQAAPGVTDFRNVAGASLFPLGTSGTFVPVMNASALGFGGYYDLSLACPFRLSDCLNSATFAGLYDAFRIVGVTVKVEWLCNTAPLNGGAILPTCYVYNDQDDATPPVNLATQTGKQGVKVIALGNGNLTSFTHRIKPYTAPVLAAPTPTSGISQAGQWINCGGNGPTVPHYGLKMYITDILATGSAGVNNAFKFTFKYDIEFRSPLLTT